jgi:hypothetical protein
MPNSNGHAAFGRRSGTVTVIEEPVRRNAARTAKITFWAVSIVTGLLTAAVAASYWHPIIALLAGTAVGVVIGLLTAALIIAWPVVRAIWWWLAEILTGLAVTGGWIELADHTTLPYRIATIAAIAGIPAAVGPVRRRIIALAWCVITRHRLRTCFTEFIITNRTGSLPLILWARPTAVGERVWIWLRPGLALEDVQQRLDLIAVACWAASATVEPASTTNSAHIRLDIKRRDALTATLRSPLTGLIGPARAAKRSLLPVPSALDLPDVDATDLAPARPSRSQPKAPAAMPAPRPAPAATPADDIGDWI